MLFHGVAVRQALFARHDNIDNIEIGGGGLKNRLVVKLVDNWPSVSTVLCNIVCRLSSNFANGTVQCLGPWIIGPLAHCFLIMILNDFYKTCCKSSISGTNVTFGFFHRKMEITRCVSQGL